MKKILMLFILIFLVGCGASVESEVEYNSKDDSVVLTSNVEISSAELEEVNGGKAAIKTALEQSLWDEAVLSDVGTGFLIETKFDSLEDYNKFMVEKTSEEGITFTEKFNTLGVLKEYEEGDNVSEYLDGEASEVFNKLTFSASSVDVDDMISSHYLTTFIDGYEFEYSDDILTIEDNYDMSKPQITYNYSLDFDKIKEESVDGNFSAVSSDYNVKFDMKISKKDKYYKKAKENLEKYGFDVKYEDKKLKVSGKFDAKSSHVYSPLNVLNCQLSKDNLFYTKFKCNESKNEYSNTNYLTINEKIYFDDYKFKHIVNEKLDISKKMNKEVTEYKLVNIIVVGGIFLILLILGLIIFKSRKKDDGVYSKMKHALTGSNETSKEDVAKLESKSLEEDTESKVVEAENEETSEGEVVEGEIIENSDNLIISNEGLFGVINKVNSFISISLIINLLILLTPVFLIKFNSITESMGMGNIKGGVFVNNDFGVLEGMMNLLSSEFGEINTSLGKNIGIILMVVTSLLIIKHVLQQLSIISLSPKMNKLIDIYYSLFALVMVIVVIVADIFADVELIGISEAYYVLIILLIAKLLMTIRNMDIYLSINSKYLLLLMIFPLLNTFVLNMNLELLFESVLSFSSSSCILIFNNSQFFAMTLITTIVLITLIVLELKKKITPKVSNIAVASIATLFLIYLIWIKNYNGNTQMMNVEITFSIVTYLYIMASIGIIVINSLNLVREYKSAKQGVTEQVDSQV
ncbi:MAG: hypothetical protein ACK5NF_03965 [Bacilli bacterium]